MSELWIILIILELLFSHYNCFFIPKRCAQKGHPMNKKVHVFGNEHFEHLFTDKMFTLPCISTFVLRSFDQYQKIMYSGVDTNIRAQSNL